MIAVIVGWIAAQLAPDHVADAGRVILIPGALADFLLSGNVHAGFGGFVGVAVSSVGSLLFWSFLVFASFKQKR